MGSSFVPAWKRLGLQLKNAHNAHNSSSMLQNEPLSGGHKRKIDNTGNDNEPSHPTESQKVFQDQPPAKVYKDNKPTKIKLYDDSLDTAAKQSSSSNQSSTSNRSSTTNPPSSTNQSSTANRSSSANKSSTANNQPRQELHERDKRNRNKSSGSKKTVTSARKKEKWPYLNYLDSYYISRATWKFNKATQNQLLRDVFTDRIPKEYHPALFAYIQGLQGQAARDRLREEAMAVIAVPPVSQSPGPETESERRRNEARQQKWVKDTEEGIKQGEDDDKDIVKEQALHDVLKRQQTASDFAKKAKKRKFAELLLAALDSAPGPCNRDRFQFKTTWSNPIDLVDSHDDAKRRRVRKRDRRTGVPDDDEVSDFEEEEEDQEPAADPRTQNVVENGSADGNGAGSQDGQADDNGEGSGSTSDSSNSADTSSEESQA
ncbi:MAG: hypothetical protein M1831_003980 [Alyxoria varia]|nr:MAG: hypothetical protein M1831_003980 [Alyxoria varia]